MQRSIKAIDVYRGMDLLVWNARRKAPVAEKVKTKYKNSDGTVTITTDKGMHVLTNDQIVAIRARVTNAFTP
jgi:hypothetical protein